MKLGRFKFFITVALFIIASMYFFRVNNGNTRAICEICSKLIIKTQRATSMTFFLMPLFLNLNRLQTLFCFFPLLNLNKYMPAEIRLKGKLGMEVRRLLYCIGENCIDSHLKNGFKFHTS